MAAIDIGQSPSFRRSVTRSTLAHPVFWFAVVVWVALNAEAIKLSGGVLPFDRPAFASMPYAVQMAAPTVGLLEIFLLMAVVWFLTRKTRNSRHGGACAGAGACRGQRRSACSLTRWPDRWAAGDLGPALGGRPFSFSSRRNAGRLQHAGHRQGSDRLVALQFRSLRRGSLSRLPPALFERLPEPAFLEPPQRSSRDRRRARARGAVGARRPSGHLQTQHAPAVAAPCHSCSSASARCCRRWC